MISKERIQELERKVRLSEYDDLTENQDAMIDLCQLALQAMNAKMPSELQASEEVWKRIHKHEDRKDPSGLPEYIIKDVTAEAYWTACYRWLKERMGR